MKTVYLLLLFISASLGKRPNYDCLQNYAQCAERNDIMNGNDRCRASDAFMECLTDVTVQCFPELADAVMGYRILIEEGCHPHSTLANDLMITGHCVSTNIQQFEYCKLEGDFNNLSEFCSSITNLTRCFRLRTEDICGERNGQLFQRAFKPITDLTASCERSQDSKDYILEKCDKGFLKCNRHILSPKGYSCSDLEENAKCYMKVFRNDCDKKVVGPYIPILERYVPQIPDYCNPESAFRQNFGKSYNCMFSNFPVILPCREEHQNNVRKTVTDRYDDAEQLALALIRVHLKFYDCMVQKLGGVCGNEAAFSARYILSPIKETMEDTCLQLTGGKCSGTVALTCSLTLLFLSLAYILTKGDQ